MQRRYSRYWLAWKILELWGQLRRKYFCHFFPERVAEEHKRRRGACNGCTKCCRLVFKCPYLDKQGRCSIYDNRFMTCINFPIDERDNMGLDCGFKFEPRKEAGRLLGLPLAPWAKKEIVLMAVAFVLGSGSGLAIAWLDGLPGGYAITAFFSALFLVTLLFFRDPSRAAPQDGDDLLAPADGRVTDVVEVDEPEYLGGRALRVGIFMSIFDVHVNRTPCSGAICFVRHRDGEWGNLLFEKAWERNENLLIGLEGDHGPLAVRLVAGAIARRIECELEPGVCVERGSRIGMVKFGSRAEVIVPLSRGWRPVVAKGQKVKAGVTALFVRDEETEAREEERS